MAAELGSFERTGSPITLSLKRGLRAGSTPTPQRAEASVSQWWRPRYLYNNRAALPSRELGVSSYATVTSLCEANAIDNLLSKPNATINTCGVIG